MRIPIYTAYKERKAVELKAQQDSDYADFIRLREQARPTMQKAADNVPDPDVWIEANREQLNRLLNVCKYAGTEYGKLTYVWLNPDYTWALYDKPNDLNPWLAGPGWTMLTPYSSRCLITWDSPGAFRIMGQDLPETLNQGDEALYGMYKRFVLVWKEIYSELFQEAKP